MNTVFNCYKNETTENPNLSNFYINITTNSWENCIINCKTCFDSSNFNSMNCLSCNIENEYFPIEGTLNCSKKNKKIPYYYFSEKFQKFKNCEEGYLFCDSNSEEYLEDEYYNEIFNEKENYPCVPGYYFSQSKCNKIPENKYFNKENNKLEDCHFSCLTCFGSEENECITCNKIVLNLNEIRMKYGDTFALKIYYEYLNNLKNKKENISNDSGSESLNSNSGSESVNSNFERESVNSNSEYESVNSNSGREIVNSNSGSSSESENVNNNSESENNNNSSGSENINSNSENENVNSNLESENVNSSSESENNNNSSGSENINSNSESENVNSNSESENINSSSGSENINSNSENENVNSNSESENINNS